MMGASTGGGSFGWMNRPCPYAFMNEFVLGLRGHRSATGVAVFEEELPSIRTEDVQPVVCVGRYALHDETGPVGMNATEVNVS